MRNLKQSKKYNDMLGFFVFISILLAVASKMYEMGIISFILIVGFFTVALFFFFRAWLVLLRIGGMIYEKWLKEFIENLRKTKEQVQSREI